MFFFFLQRVYLKFLFFEDIKLRRKKRWEKLTSLLVASRSACHGLFISSWKPMGIARERGFLCVWILFYAFIKQIFPSVTSYAPRFSRCDKTTMFPPVVYRLSTERKKKYFVFPLVYYQRKMIQKLHIIFILFHFFLLENKLITWIFTWFEFWNVSNVNKQV